LSLSILPGIVITATGVGEFGDRLLAELKYRSSFSNISFILLTDNNDEEQKIKAISYGADDLISRPLSKAELLFRIDKLINENSAQREFSFELDDPPGKKLPRLNDRVVPLEDKKPLVLVVDDNRLIRKQLKDYVESLGCIVITAADGFTAHEVTQKHDLDLILLDIILPDFGGMELLEMVRQQKNLLQLPVIIISGLSDSDSKLKALELGADDYITKPIDFNELQIKMRTVLRKKYYFEEVTQNYHRAVKRSITDSLTDLYNRGYFHEFLEREIKRCRRYHHDLTLIIADIDFFKKYNDRYGHPRGDIVLRNVANILKQNIRGSDLAARYGGEEFAIVLPETDLAGGLTVAEKIRSSVEIYNFSGEHYSQPGGTLTISLGVSSIPATDKHTTLTEFITRADKALYEAKRKGRNLVVSV
ncbi:MAG: diguanylate cyclase, partial [Firmicutes bacterium]|nr:diguanylate cyclase [Bacillota bacterium]